MEKYVHSEVRLASSYGGSVPPIIVAHALHAVVPAARSATYMAIEGRGKLAGRPRKWEADVADIRFNGAAPSHNEMVLRFAAPRLGMAAPHLYEQRDFWRSPPTQDTTPIDLLINAISEVSKENRDSDSFDQGVLRDIGRFSRVVEKDDIRLAFTKRIPHDHKVEVTSATIEHVRSLSRATPAPHAIRLVGALDMIRASTQGFALQLDDGSEFSGIYEGGDISELKALFKSRVLVNGMLVYRPSGKPLRIDATRVILASGESSLWTRLPPPPDKLIGVHQLRRPQMGKTGIRNIVGRWPSNESDDEVEDKLISLS